MYLKYSEKKTDEFQKNNTRHKGMKYLVLRAIEFASQNIDVDWQVKKLAFLNILKETKVKSVLIKEMKKIVGKRIR